MFTRTNVVRVAMMVLVMGVSTMGRSQGAAHCQSGCASADRRSLQEVPVWPRFGVEESEAGQRVCRSSIPAGCSGFKRGGGRHRLFICPTAGTARCALCDRHHRHHRGCDRLPRKRSAPPKNLTAATPYWPADDPKVISLARQITDGKTTNGAKALAILEWLTPGQNVKYSGQTGSRWGTAKVLEQKFGRCWDFSDCFVTLARAAGVPSRQVAGWLYCSDGHVWAEFYREGKGWQQVDPTGGGKLRCGIYHIPYFTSEDGEMPILVCVDAEDRMRCKRNDQAQLKDAGERG